MARWIIEKAHVKKPIKRLWISSVTDKAIKEGFNKLKDGKQYENLYASAVARAEADWLVGINATRALTTKYNAQLSCGRVQTPTLYMIAAREQEIINFKPQEFYGVTARVRGLILNWHDPKTNEQRIFDKARSEAIQRKIQQKNATVTSVDKINKKQYSPQLYDLTELQRDANKLFGFSAKETLSIMQKLYESHKVLTYPRTDSRYLSTDIVDTLKERVKACGVGAYSKFAMNVLNRGIKANKNFVDNSKVSDHHAIIPTEQIVPFSKFSDKERKVYELVVKRFFAVLLPSFEFEQTTIKACIEGESFMAKGKRVLSLGWKELYQDVSDEDDLDFASSLPNLEKGTILKVENVSLNKGYTSPPAPFNEGTLLSAMENPKKYMTAEKDLLKIIGETGGIGTVATRADIIEKLFNSFLIEKRGKDIFITSKGKQLLDLVPEELKSPNLTAQWEQKLESIAKGNLKKESFIKEVREYTKETIQDIKKSSEKFKHDNLTRSRCPECGKYMLEVNGKKGKILVCQDRECGHREGIAKITNARCPQCRKKLELRGQGEGEIFVCKCGFKEKMSAFKARRKEDDSKANKKDVTKFLKEQKKEKDEPLNSALADALAKLNLSKNK